MHITATRVALAVGALLAASAALADTTPPPQTPGTWTKHQYSFAFMGFTSTYSCDGLADKLKELLITAGARPDVYLQPRRLCLRVLAGLTNSAAPISCSIRSRPRAATRPRRRRPARRPTPPSPPVGGIWRPVKFAAYSPHDVGLGDCELIEQFSQRLLPMFTTRNVDNHVNCVPYELSGSQLDLRFDAFAAAPKLAAGNP